MSQSTPEADGAKGRPGFASGAAVLGGAGLIGRIIGALYRIPLANVLGTEGSGYYGIAYPVYSAVAAAATIGIPTAISQLVAGYIGTESIGAAERVFVTARRFLFILGAALTATFIVLAGALAELVKEPPAAEALQAVSPALLFVCVISCYRGVFQGFGNMKPAAMSQVLEQCGKLGLGLTAAWAVDSSGGTPAESAAAALGGIACSEAAVMLYLSYSYRHSTVFRKLHEERYDHASSNHGMLRLLVSTAIPVTLGACVMPIILAMDSVFAAPALQSAGMDARAAASQLGLLTMNVEPLVNIPSALSAALAMNVVPAIALLFARHDNEECQERMQLSMKIAVMVGLPCAAGFALFGRPIIALLFTSLNETELDTAGAMLSVMGIGVLCLTVIHTATGVLQGIGKNMLPVVALCTGAAIKASTILPLVRSLGIVGAAWSSVLCFAAVLILDLFFVRRSVMHMTSWVRALGWPLAATAVMAAISICSYALVSKLSSNAAVLCAICAGAVVYAFTLCRSGWVSATEIEMLPGGNVLVSLTKRLGMWKENT